MVDIGGSLTILDKLFKGIKYLYQLYKKNPARYLTGSLSTGLELSYRIIALFEAHNVKRTQIYLLLGKQFPKISPTLDAGSLKDYINGEMLEAVSKMFGVRQSWLEGEAGPIYEPLLHYKGLKKYIDFIDGLNSRNSQNYSTLFVYKSSTVSEDLYADCPHVALVFAEHLIEIGDKQIYRYYPVYGTFPWTHGTARYHLSAYFNIADNTPDLIIKGFSASSKQVEEIGSGEIMGLCHVCRTGGQPS